LEPTLYTKIFLDVFIFCLWLLVKFSNGASNSIHKKKEFY
jgi:hypothetical protein